MSHDGTTGGGARVIMLDEGHGLSGEDVAKLQALYSRSDGSVVQHLDKVRAGNSSTFMDRYYVGYGHPSIADCATTVVFIEGLTHAAAKAIQDHPLYNGQEMSTRYVDCAARPLVGGDALRDVQEAWLRAYRATYDAVSAELEASTPEEGPASVRRNAIHARACDVARGFLPIGSTTQCSWTTTLRQFGERLAALRHHPLAEVRDIAGRVLGDMAARHPGSFRLQDYPTRDGFYAGCAMPLHYARKGEAMAGHDDVGPGELSVRSSVDATLLAALPERLWVGRPEKTTLPRPMAAAARFSFAGPLDYGSFRDVQRHRGGLCRIPLVEGPVAIHPWYLDRVPDAVRDAVLADVALAAERVEALRVGVAEGDDEGLAALQYAYPLGHMVPTRVDYDLVQAVYVSEMRGSRHVHPTLRHMALQMADAVRRAIPGMPVHVDDFERDGFDLRRGTQTIVERAG